MRVSLKLSELGHSGAGIKLEFRKISVHEPPDCSGRAQVPSLSVSGLHVKVPKSPRDSADLRHADRPTAHHSVQHCRLRKAPHFYRVFHNAATLGLAERETAIFTNHRN